MAKRRPSGDGMVRKRDDGRWEGRIVVGHKKNSAPIFQHAYARTQKELTDKLHQSIERYQDVELTEDSRMTLGEWLDRWLREYKEGTVRHGTLQGYRSVIENHIKPSLGCKQVSLVTAQDVQRFYKKLKENGRVREHPQMGTQLSDTTVNRVHGILHQAMEDAVRAHVIARNPTTGATAPKACHAPKRVLTDEELDTFLAAVQADEVWGDFFYVELTTGLRRRKETAITQWIFPDPIRPELPLSPHSAYIHLKKILEKAGLPDIRFHDLRHTFATHAIAGGVDAKTLSGILGHTNASFTLAPENGMDVKTLSAMLGHVSAATMLDIYTHITNDMQRSAAASIDRSIGKSEPQEAQADPEETGIVDFQPYIGPKRKPGTGCITEINDHLFEGRYSPTWVDGKKHARNVYARTREECEEKLAALITEMNEERKNLKEQLAGVAPPIRLTKIQRKLWDYMRLHPEVTQFATIAKQTGLSRNTVKKYYGMMGRL